MIGSLREALGLSLHDLFNNSICHGHAFNKTFGYDVQDTNHGALKPAQLQHTPLPQSPQLLLTLPRRSSLLTKFDLKMNVDLEDV